MAGRQFRVFVSSTFADLNREREALRLDVFPRLQTLCRRHGATFQAVDLRWGVSEEAAREQRTVAICLDEVDRCLSGSPPMIVLLGDRYGWRPLPDPIPGISFDAIRASLPRAVGDELANCYTLDKNALAPEYRLRRRDELGTRDVDWPELEARLRRALITGARSAGLEEADLRRLSASATELEILRGAMGRDDVYVYLRTIDGLPEGTVAGQFGEPDGDARDALARLKRDLAERGRDRVRHYRAHWTGEGVGSEHLRALCDDVFRDLHCSIRARWCDALPDEAHEHSAFAEDRARVFVGRQAPLESIAGVLANANHHTPLAVLGPPGSGKSTVLARIVTTLRPRRPDLATVVRFIGATAASTAGHRLLAGICREIALEYGADESAVPTAYRDLADAFPEYLGLANASRPLLVVVDALDQLATEDPARELAWLPSELPPHVHVVVSATEDLQAALTAFLSAEDLLELEPMTRREGADLLRKWLEGVGRRLQVRQRNRVLDAFEHTGRPLHLRLLAAEARRWASSSPLPCLGQDEREVVGALFDRLSAESEHGPVLVERALAYLAAARHGLSDEEMLDVLSRDDDVMDDFRRRSPRSPTVDRLPPIVWSRLYFDVQPYLTERGGDGATLLGFFHRQFSDVVAERYMAGAEGRDRHRALARFFAAQPLDAAGGANLRKLSELPYQQVEGELWREAFTTLTDFDFIERKVSDAAVEERTDAAGNRTHIHGGVYLLQDDYRHALARWPE